MNPLHVTYVAVECGPFASPLESRTSRPGQCWRLIKLPQTHMGILNPLLLCCSFQHSLRQSGVRFLLVNLALCILPAFQVLQCRFKVRPTSI